MRPILFFIIVLIGLACSRKYPPPPPPPIYEPDFSDCNFYNDYSAKERFYASYTKTNIMKQLPLRLALLLCIAQTGFSQLQLKNIYQEDSAALSGLHRSNGVAVSKDNRSVYVAADDAVVVFSRNGTTGALSVQQTVADMGIGAPYNLVYGAYRICLSPDQNQVFATSTFALRVFNRNAATGLLTPHQVLDISQTGFCGSNGEIVCSGDGKHIYVLSNCGDDGILTLERNPATGIISFLDVMQADEPGLSCLEQVEGLDISPDGKSLYTASPNASCVTMFSRNPATGLLLKTQDLMYASSQQALAYARKVRVSPDGKQVYAATNFNSDGAMAVLSRDTTTGMLTYAQELLYLCCDDPLEVPESIEIAPNGKYVYVSSNFGNSISLFARDLESGLLRYVKSYTDTLGGSLPLGLPLQVAVSPDNRDLYVASVFTNGVLHFKIELFLGNDGDFCLGDTLTLMPNRSFSNYIWSTGQTGVGMIDINESGDYALTATDEFGFTETDTISINFYLPDAYIGNDTSLQYGESIYLFPFNGFATFQWFDGSTYPGLVIQHDKPEGDTLFVWLYATDANGCSDADTLVLILQKSVATGEPGQTFEVSVAPNPASGLTTVFLPGISGKTTLGLYAPDGRLLVSRTCQNEKETLNLSELPQGCYLLKITGPEGQTVKKIIRK